MIVPLRLSLSNAYLIKGERPVLIDTGCPGDTARLLKMLEREQVKLEDRSFSITLH
jgi:hypothetical protein